MCLTPGECGDRCLWITRMCLTPGESWIWVFVDHAHVSDTWRVLIWVFVDHAHVS